MTAPTTDTRSRARKERDDVLAGEAPLSPPPLASDVAVAPVEEHLRRLQRRPLALAGVVENGVVRPLDPSVKLTERAQVIIVTSEAAEG